MPIAAIAALVTIGLHTMLFSQTGAWQVLLAASGAALGLVFLIVAYVLVRRRKPDAAGFLVFLALLVAYGCAELFLAGATWYLAIGGILLIILAGTIALPRRWSVWLVAAILYGLYVFLVNLLEPFPRYDHTQSAVLRLYVPTITILLALGFVWLVIRAFRTGTIRTRLLIAFVTVVLLPAVIISTAPIAIGLQRGRQQAVDQLELAAAFKEAEINDWTDNLQAGLDTALTRRNAIIFARVELGWRLESTPINYNNLMLRFREYIEQTQQFETLFLLDLQGQVVASTDETQEGQDLSSQPYFQAGRTGPYTSFYSTPSNEMGIVAVQPVLDDEGQTLGVMAGYADVETLKEIMRKQIRMGETERLYLVSSDHVLFTEPPLSHVHTEGVDAVLETESSSNGLYEDHQGEPVVGVYVWLPELQGALLAEQDQAEAFRAMYVTLGVSVGVALASVVLAVIASLFITRSIANPMTELAGTATQIAAGDLERSAKVEREDEVGALARAFNSMTAQLRGLIGSLEQRVADRTRYLEASAEVSRVATSILETEQLIRQIVELIREQFGLYFVGLFLVDETGEWAALRAGTGEAGQAMLARGYQIRIGEGMTGWSIANAQPRVALDVDKDLVRLAEAELPDTRSEAALPLRSRGRVLGALDVQSDQPAVFDEATISVWQTMADQLAVALDNALLLAETQEALEATRRAYVEQSRDAWNTLLRSRPEWGYSYEHESITPATGAWRPEMLQAAETGQSVQGSSIARDGGAALAIPLKVRDQVVGVLDLQKGEGDKAWTADEIALLETMVGQLNVALEGAQLYQDTQRRAAREQLIGEVTARMRETLDLETVLQTAIREIGDTLDLAEVEVRLGSRAKVASATRPVKGEQ
jgi:GAF domain-containing protein/HAMP domain-containing protein